jgi:hypothetical protein
MIKAEQESEEAEAERQGEAAEAGQEGEVSMDERNAKAFDYARGLTTQLLTLSTGIIAVTLTFAKNFLNGATGSARNCLAFGWLAFVISILAGLIAWMGMVSQLSPCNSQQDKAPSIWDLAVQVPAIIQCLCFFAAVALIAAAGAIAI